MSKKNEDWTKAIADNKYYKIISKSEILKLYDSFYKMYNNMASLEKEGKQNSEEYKEIRDLIPVCLEIEKEKISKIDSINNAEMEELIEQIACLNYDDEDQLDDTIYKEEALLDKTDLYQTTKIKRLLTRLREYGLLRTESYTPYEDDEDNLGIDDYNDLETTQKGIMSINGESVEIPLEAIYKFIAKWTNKDNELDEKQKKELDKDINTAFYFKDTLVNITLLNKIEEQIQKETNEKIKNVLIDYKYNLIYTTLTLESHFAKKEDFIEQQFKYHHLIELLAEIKPEIYEDYYDGELKYEIKQRIAKLANKEYNKNNSKLMNELDDTIEKLYIESLLQSMVNKNTYNDIIDYTSVSKNELKNEQSKKNITDIEKTVKELKLKR